MSDHHHHAGYFLLGIVIGLVAGLVVALVAIYGYHRMQAEREGGHSHSRMPAGHIIITIIIIIIIITIFTVYKPWYKV